MEVDQHNNEGVKTALVFITRYVDSESPNAICLKKVISSFPEGYRFDVITSSSHIKGCELSSFEKGRIIQLGVSSILSSNKGNGPIASILRWLRRVYHFVFPWYFFNWAIKAYILAKSLYKHTEYSCIITNSLPFDNHIPGLLFKKKHKEIPWIAYVLDPYVNNPICKSHNIIANYVASKIENLVFSACDSIVKLSNITIDTQYQYKSVDVGIPVLNHSELAVANPIKHSGDSRVIVYAGSFLKGVREANPVIELIDQLNQMHLVENCRFEFFTNTSSSDGKLLRELATRWSNVVVQSYVPAEVIDRILTNADVLLSVGNSTDLQIPSKTINYMNYRKPIIHFACCENDPVLPYLFEYGNALVVGTCQSHPDEYKQVVDFLKYGEFSSPEKGNPCFLLDTCRSIYTVNKFIEIWCQGYEN